ncbi:nitrilase-related carbon-nitrogen hydrolase [uncultured Desulfobulbus sp.]|uniref:nitrilase-related carbon-nitrogen hydrolase n=1 Tax=uncultured Desulfobulbus sp. TaxID=239745 RepID=UPI0029C612AB|nr:nitrilase-related carbon-nitrogen hydrolase [uncultured Desulfobulbus sp.]
MFLTNRKHRKWTISIGIILLICGGYHVWRMTGREGYTGDPQLNIELTYEYGKDFGNGNIVAIQPWILGADYSSAQAFRSKLDGYFREADRKGWLRKNTIVVLPEYLGAWLLCAGEKRSVWEAPTIMDAMKMKVLSNIPSIIAGAVLAPCADRTKYAIFRSSGKKSASIYDKTLSYLARKYHITIAGGSVILPSPYVEDGHLRTTGKGPLYNVSPVYRPDGNAYPELVIKVFVTADEKDFVSPGKIDDLPVFDTPSGKLGVLICADSWFPQAFRVLSQKQAKLVVVSSFIGGDSSLREIWKGYSNAKTPSDVNPTDPEKITSFEAWKRYTLPGRISGTGIQFGVLSCLRGQLWDLGSDSFVCAVRDGKPSVSDSPDGAVLTNVWIGRSQGK